MQGRADASWLPVILEIDPFSHFLSVIEGLFVLVESSNSTGAGLAGEVSANITVCKAAGILAGSDEIGATHGEVVLS